MELKTVIGKIHRTIEAEKNIQIRQSDMAELIGVSSRTYGEYMRGNIDPKGMHALLTLLSMLSDIDLIKIIRLWEEVESA